MKQQKKNLIDTMVKTRFSPVEESTFSIYEEYEAFTGVSLIFALENLKKPSQI